MDSIVGEKQWEQNSSFTKIKTKSDWKRGIDILSSDVYEIIDD